jgi:hypothetical protein
MGARTIGCPNCGWVPQRRVSGVRRLSAAQVRKIRAETRTLREMSVIYGVSQVSLWKVRSRLTYKDVA